MDLSEEKEALWKQPRFVRMSTTAICGTVSALLGFSVVKTVIVDQFGMVDSTVFGATIAGLFALLGTIAAQAFFAGTEEAEEQLEMALREDVATGLLSRRGFEQALQEFTAAHDNGNDLQNLHLVAFEFDSIKDVNEIYGHEIGDMVIRIVADRLQHMVGDLGPVARIGGSEYVLAMSAVSNDRELKAAVDALITAMSRPIKLGALSLAVFGNAGVVKLNRRNPNLVAALRCATLARASARDAGRGTWTTYHPEMSQLAAYRKWIESELSSAIQRSELALHYQPQVHRESGKVVSYEALLRWTHHEKGSIGPSEFISIAESCGLIRHIGLWVLHKACEDALHFPNDINVSVNVSTVQIMDADFIRDLRRVIQSTGIEPSRLELEVTESIVITDFRVIRERFAAIRDIGCTIAIDDFGTGYSNLTNLAELPFQKLKIDKSFVDRMSSQKSISSIVATIVNLGHSLDATVVAEGVETEEQAAILTAAGCQIMQGYYYGKPLSLRDALTNEFAPQPEQQIIAKRSVLGSLPALPVIDQPALAVGA